MKPHQKHLIRLAAMAAMMTCGNAAELHVAITGSDASPGTSAAPLRTIQRAADLAQPGDTVTVHAGVYRERVNPPRGGESDTKRIVYQAAPGEQVVITGSEAVKQWEKVQDGVWKTTLPDTFFGSFNPFAELISGDWFDAKGRNHHAGAVYLNGDWLTEAVSREEVMKPMTATPLWFASVDATRTVIWAQFKGVDPNEQLVEINVRRTVFYPEKPGRNFITVRGFTLHHAATPWAPPTAEQVALIGTHWSMGWIIEDNIITHSACSGLSLGKYGDDFDNKSSNSAEGYVGTINRALKNGWNKETIGHHLVRNNTISHCGQAGIVGSLGAAFSKVIGNTVHDIHVVRDYDGCEQAGIKFHGAIDTEIRGNHVYRAYRGLWLDWMAQGTRVTGNLFHDNSEEDIYAEVNHGPFVVDNNLLLSPRSLWDMSEGGAYVHNLLTGKIDNWYDMGRLTPHLKAHSTAVAGLTITQGGDNRYFNNIFVGQGLPGDAPVTTTDPKTSISGFGLWVYDARNSALQTGGNLYLNGARPHAKEVAALALAEVDPSIRLVEKPDGWYLEMTRDKAWIVGANSKLVDTELLGMAAIPKLPFENPDGHYLTMTLATALGSERPSQPVTSARLGKASISGCAFENPDGSPITIGTDYFGKPRNPANPTPGPFEAPGTGVLTMKVWPLAPTGETK